MTKYINCEDCFYQYYCENFDPFFGCSNGQVIESDKKFIILGVDTDEILQNNRKRTDVMPSKSTS